jgi:hypothetical protein
VGTFTLLADEAKELDRAGFGGPEPTAATDANVASEDLVELLKCDSLKSSQERAKALAREFKESADGALRAVMEPGELLYAGRRKERPRQP